MRDWTLPRAQQEFVSQVLEQQGLDPLDFDLRVGLSRSAKDTRISMLVHRETGSYFEFDTFDLHGQLNGYFVRYKPGNNEPLTVVNAGKWNYLTSHILTWISSLQADLNASSPWHAFAEAESFGRFATGSDNPSFTNQEQALVATAIGEVKLLVSSQSQLSSDRIRILENDLDHLSEAVKRVGKKDWILMFVGWGVNAALTNALSANVLSQVFQIMSDRLHPILSTLKMLLDYFTVLPK